MRCLKYLQQVRSCSLIAQIVLKHEAGLSGDHKSFILYMFVTHCPKHLAFPGSHTSTLMLAKKQVHKTQTLLHTHKTQIVKYTLIISVLYLSITACMLLCSSYLGLKGATLCTAKDYSELQVNIL